VSGTGSFDDPWGRGELVAKVGGKGLAFIGPASFSVKCGRDAAEAAPVAALPRHLRP
jgi:hypothetical protein